MQSQNDVVTKIPAISASQNGMTLNVSRQWGYSAQFVVSNIVGSISAAAKIQASNDGENWEDISGATKTLNSASAQMINLNALTFNYIRSVVTYTSGTADIKIIEVTKGA